MSGHVSVLISKDSTEIFGVFLCEQEHQRNEKHSHPDLFSSLKLGVLIIYFHQAVGKASIIDEIMLYSVSEFLALPGLSSLLNHSKNNTQ